MQDFREDYEDAGIVGAYIDKNLAERELVEWEKDNEDNCDEIRYLVEQEVNEDNSNS